MRTNDNWKAKGAKDTNPFSNYQRNLDRKLSEPKRFEDPYKNVRNSFRSSIGFKKWLFNFNKHLEVIINLTIKEVCPGC